MPHLPPLPGTSLNYHEPGSAAPTPVHIDVTLPLPLPAISGTGTVTPPNDR